MTNKTPFELRYEFLNLAREHLMQKYYAQVDFARDTKGTYPEFPTEKEIFDLAESFKNFVDNK